MTYLGQGFFLVRRTRRFRQYHVDIFADCARSRGVIPRGGWICIKLSCFGAHKGAQPRRGGFNGAIHSDVYIYPTLWLLDQIFDVSQQISFEQQIYSFNQRNTFLPKPKTYFLLNMLDWNQITSLCCLSWLDTRICPGSWASIFRKFLSTFEKIKR